MKKNLIIDILKSIRDELASLITCVSDEEYLYYLSEYRDIICENHKVIIPEDRILNKK